MKLNLKYYVCNRCDEFYAGLTDKENILCGSLVGFVSVNGDDVPVGCGGNLSETTEKEATEAAFKKRDNNG